ncbi:MAG: phage holin family protein [Candidatus Pacebacteria bacterium]|nr:phage holin family protein [Candidatus Paceibacterota bacterium]
MISRGIARLIISALALIAVAYLLPGITVSSFYIAVITAIILGAVNIFIRPIIFLLTLPINIVTFGLFSFIINGLLLWFVASFIDGFYIDGYISALLGAIILAFFGFIGNWFVKKVSDD